MVSAKHQGMQQQLLLLLLLVANNLLHAAADPARITLSPSTLTQNGQLITVTWSDIPVVGNVNDYDNLMKADTIALVQSDSSFGTKWPIKYIWVSQTAAATYKQGRGSATFWVHNHRQALQFLYLRYPDLNTGIGEDFAWGKQTILASATLSIHPALAKAPQQLRLSLLGFNAREDNSEYDPDEGYAEAARVHAHHHKRHKHYTAEHTTEHTPTEHKTEHKTQQKTDAGGSLPRQPTKPWPYDKDEKKSVQDSNPRKDYRQTKKEYHPPSNGYNSPPDNYHRPDEDYKGPHNSYKGPRNSYSPPDKYNQPDGDNKGPHNSYKPSHKGYSVPKPDPYRDPAASGPPYNGPDSRSGRDVQITWQSSLPGGIAVVSRFEAEVESFWQWMIDDYPMSTRVLDKRASSRRRPLLLEHASYETYTPEDMCGFPANSTGWLDPGYNNYAVWRGLQHNTRYYYFVGSGASGFSSIRTFLTPPLSVADCFSYEGQRECDDYSCSRECLKAVAPVRLLLAADLGTNNHLDGTWSADGQGFYALNAAQTLNVQNTTGLPGPIWPRRTYDGVASGIPYSFPFANLFYCLYALGDFPAWGQQPATYYVANAMNTRAKTQQYHGAFIVGDLAYAEGMSAHWDMFLSDFEDTFSTMPTMFSNGNHESADAKLPEDGLPPDPESVVPDAGGECGIVYEKRLRMPTPPNIPASKRPEYYSYVMGPVAVIVLSTEQKWGPGSLQYTWLVKQFEMFADLRAQGWFPWLVVAFHRPMYVDDPDISVGLGNQWVASQLLRDLEPLFAKYQVDMTWTGHTHFYHRSCAVYKGGCRSPITSATGDDIFPPVHVMVGNGGFQPGASVFNETPPWIEVETFKFGYCTLEVSDTDLAMECFDAVNGAKFDEMTLSKPVGWRPSQDEAEAYYASVAAVPIPPGVNITGELGPLQDWFFVNSANLSAWALNNTGALTIPVLVAIGFYEDKSVNGQLVNAVPGTRLYSMADVVPIAFDTMSMLGLLEETLPPELRFPAIEEIDYIRAINAPAQPNVNPPTYGGRLWRMVNGTSPKRRAIKVQ